MIFKQKKKDRKEKPYKLGEYFVWGSSKKKAEKDLRRYLGESKFEKKVKK